MAADVTRQSPRRRIGVLTVFLVGVWAIAATSPAPPKEFAISPVVGTLTLDAERPAAVALVRVVVPPEAGPSDVDIALALNANGPRLLPAPEGTRVSAVGKPVPDVRFVVMDAGPDALWQADVEVGASSVQLPVNCREGPCERGFWLIAQAAAPPAAPIEVGWSIAGNLRYSSDWLEGAAVSITADPQTSIAGPAPALVVSTPEEIVTLGPDAPAAARVLEVTLDRHGDAGVTTALQVDVSGGSTIVSSVIPLDTNGSAYAGAEAAVAEGTDPFAGCSTEPCARQFLVTFAWTGQTQGPTPVHWSAALRRTDLDSVWASGATMTAEVVRAVDLAAGKPRVVHLEGDVVPGPNNLGEGDVEVWLQSTTDADDPLVAGLPVPMVLTYEAAAVGMDAATKEADRTSARVTGYLGNGANASAHGPFVGGKVRIVLAPTVSEHASCAIGSRCPRLVMDIDPLRAGGDRPTDIRYHWTLDIETYSYEGIPITLSAGDPVTSTPPPSASPAR